MYRKTDIRGKIVKNKHQDSLAKCSSAHMLNMLVLTSIKPKDRQRLTSKTMVNLRDNGFENNSKHNTESISDLTWPPVQNPIEHSCWWWNLGTCWHRKACHLAPPTTTYTSTTTVIFLPSNPLINFHVGVVRWVVKSIWTKASPSISMIDVI